MTKSKTITMVLENGNPQGVRTAEIRNRISQAVAFPRAEFIFACADKNLDRPGVYILVEEADPTKYLLDIYVGESDNLGTRLKQHYSGTQKKDFWSDAYVIFSHDKSVTKAHVMYLEYLLIQHASSVPEINMLNGKSGHNVSLSKSEIHFVEDLYEDGLILFSVLGFNVLGFSSGSKVVPPVVTSGVFEMKVEKAFATMIEDNNKFVVQKGSTARATENSSAGDSVRKLRAKLLADGTLVPKGSDLLEFSTNCGFAKISAAASVIAGGNRNGNQTWVLKGTKTTYGSVVSQNGSS